MVYPSGPTTGVTLKIAPVSRVSKCRGDGEESGRLTGRVAGGRGQEIRGVDVLRGRLDLGVDAGAGDQLEGVEQGAMAVLPKLEDVFRAEWGEGIGAGQRRRRARVSMWKVWGKRSKGSMASRR
jgi:hypothetical protein